MLELLVMIFINHFALAHEVIPGKVNGAFGTYFFQTQNNSDQQQSAPKQLTFALLASADLNPKGGVEAGIFYQNKRYFLERDDNLLVEKRKRLNMKLGYRHWFHKRFSLGLSLFSAFASGDPKPVFSSFPMGSEPQTLAHKDVEYGIDLSLQWEFYIQATYIWLIDFRLEKSINGDSNDFSDIYGILIAYKKEIPYK